MSYQNFTPGKKSEARRIIDYLSLDPNNSKFLKCSAEELKKFL